MKKLLCLLMVGLIFLSSCSSDDEDLTTTSERYYDMLDLLTNVQSFSTEPVYYDLTVEVVEIEDGYRFYVIVDNAKIAMYDIQVMAIVVGEDYTEMMAPNVGIFEGVSYNMIPNQTKVDDGYVAGLSISGLTDDPEPTIDILVRYQTSNYESVIREYYRYTVTYQESESD